MLDSEMGTAEDETFHVRKAEEEEDVWSTGQFLIFLSYLNLMKDVSDELIAHLSSKILIDLFHLI